MSGRDLRALVLAAVASTLALAWWAPAARAEFGPIELISKSAKEQADEAFNPAISADGRYVAFAGKIGDRRGIFREDRQTGAIALVLQATEGEEPLRIRPSISGDGRYVAFTTAQRLDPEDDLGAESSDVYVADMSTSPPVYELASARDGCNPLDAEPHTPCGLTYRDNAGAVAAGRVALSENGRSVAFMTTTESNLAGEKTPAGEIAVRRLGSNPPRTVLVTVTMGGTGEEPVPGGGADIASEGAAISGDGSTVAWVGRHLPEQVPMLSDEAEAVRRLESAEGAEPETTEYHEPLWRRVPILAEADPPTRRVVGGGDPLAPGCPAGGTLADSACQGPFPTKLERTRPGRIGQEGFGWGISVPSLSADGETVAVVGTPDEDGDLFVVDMAPGLSRRQAVRRLTQWANPVPGQNNPESAFESPQLLPLLGPVAECAISPDGNRVAFTTNRQVFPLAPPTLVTPPPPGASEVKELYQVDLRGQTIERATPGGGGAVSFAPTGLAAGAAAPSYSDEGRLLAFASTAYNLVAGDTNGKSDAFVVESPPPASIEPTKISPRPAALVVQPLWRMTVSTASLPDGQIRIVVGVPGAGAVRVKATARLGSRLRKRLVASAHRYATTPGAQKLILHLPRKLRGMARQKGGLYAQLDIGFAGPGGKPLSAALDARFLVHRGKGKGTGKGKR